MTKNNLSLVAFCAGALLIAVVTLPFQAASTTPSDWKMEVASSNWNLDGFKNDLDISGIASVDGSHCLIVSDEGLQVQQGIIDLSTQQIEATGSLKVSPTVNLKNSEIDFEGAAYSKTTRSYFVVGSHGLAGADATFDPNRFSIYQIGVDAETGSIDEKAIKHSSLLPWIKNNPVTSPYVKKPLQENGFDIEGVAAFGKHLYFGLRGPNLDGDCLVLQIGITTLFDEAGGDLIVHRLSLGAGLGLRDIASVKDGFLFIAGSGGARGTGGNSEKGYALYFWTGNETEPAWLGTLPENKGKAEALLVLKESGEQIDALVLFDSLPGGAPLQLRLSRPGSFTSL